MTANNDDIFDEDFADFEEDNGAGKPAKSNVLGGAGGGTLLDLWNNNPLVKLALIVGLVVIAAGSVYAFMGMNSKDKEAPASRLNRPVDGSEAPGAEVSETYGNALDEQNQAKLEQALGNRNVSAIPVPVNRSDPTLLVDGTQDIQAEDPLAIWQRENRKEEPLPQTVSEPLPPPPPPPPAPAIEVPPEDLQGLSQSIAQQIQSILENRIVKPGQYQSLGISTASVAGVGANSDPTPQSGPITPVEQGEGGSQESRVEEILVPAGTILYGQIMNEANSDAPGPIIAQILSGPFAGSRMIGEFKPENEKLIISFETAVIAGVGTPVRAVAIDPSTTSPGLATDIDRRYFRRIILPAAAEFIQGLGSAYADQETQVFTSGDVIVTQEETLDTKQEFAKGVERAAEKAGELLDDDAETLEPLIRVEAGTPIGIIMVEPIVKPKDRMQYNGASAYNSTGL